MIVVLCRDLTRDRTWLVFDEDPSSPPTSWTAPPVIDQRISAFLAGDMVGCFEADWEENGPERVLSLGRRLPLPTSEDAPRRKAG